MNFDDTQLSKSVGEVGVGVGCSNMQTSILPCELGKKAFGVIPDEILPRFVEHQQGDTENHRDKNMLCRNWTHLEDFLGPRNVAEEQSNSKSHDGSREDV